MKIAIYARCSTMRQDTQNQLDQLRQFAAKQGWYIQHEYVDYESGKTDQRPEFQAMFELLAVANSTACYFGR